ncbi:unnamed protein product [Boreogadus saida]
MQQSTPSGGLQESRHSVLSDINSFIAEYPVICSSPHVPQKGNPSAPPDDANYDATQTPQQFPQFSPAPLHSFLPQQFLHPNPPVQQPPRAMGGAATPHIKSAHKRAVSFACMQKVDEKDKIFNLRPLKKIESVDGRTILYEPSSPKDRAQVNWTTITRCMQKPDEGLDKFNERFFECYLLHSGQTEYDVDNIDRSQDLPLKTIYLQQEIRSAQTMEPMSPEQSAPRCPPDIGRTDELLHPTIRDSQVFVLTPYYELSSSSPITPAVYPYLAVPFTIPEYIAAYKHDVIGAIVDQEQVSISEKHLLVNVPLPPLSRVPGASPGQTIATDALPAAEVGNCDLVFGRMAKQHYAAVTCPVGMDAGQRTQPFRGAYESGGIPVGDE